MQVYEETRERGKFKVRLTDTRTVEQREAERNLWGKIIKAVLGEGKPARLLWRAVNGVVITGKEHYWIFSEFRISKNEIVLVYIHRETGETDEVVVPMSNGLEINFCVTPTSCGSEILYQLRSGCGLPTIRVYNYEKGKRLDYFLDNEEQWGLHSSTDIAQI